MKLPVPIFLDDRIYTDCEYRKPKAGPITTAYEEAQKGHVFSAMVEFISGGLKSLSDTNGNSIDNPVELKKMIKQMPYVSGETLAIKIMTTLNKNDVLEGVYQCPRCDKPHIDDFNPELGIDNRDRVDDLKIKIMDPENYTNEIRIEPEEPVHLYNKNTGEVIQTINSFTVRQPTFNDCIVAGNNMIDGQEVRAQIRIYIKSLIRINDEPIEKNWAGIYGQLLFKNLYPEDIEAIGVELQKNGIDRRVKKICNHCGREWEPLVNTSNFFVSGLQPS